MAEKDRLKWNRKYREKPKLLQPRPAAPMVEKWFSHAEGDYALDLACGSGKNSLFLAKEGFRIDAVDISEVALSHLEKVSSSNHIRVIQTDLDTFTPVANRYDLIVMTNYLDRALIVRTIQALKAGGLFIVETYMEDERNEKKGSNPEFLLKKEELLTLFDTAAFTLLEYREFWNEPHELYRMRKEAICARKR